MQPSAIPLLLSLLCSALLVWPHAARAAEEPPVLATGVSQAGLLADGRLLCATLDGAFSVLDLASGKAEPWQPAWSPKQDGWDEEGGGGFGWKLAVSPDGKHIALARGVAITHQDPAGDYMDTAVAIVLCGPEGDDARCVALAEVTDGGPPLDFTRDSGRLAGPWFFACPPTPQGFQRYIANDFHDPSVPQFNYIDTATGAGGMQPGMPDYEFYSKATESDYFAYEGLDEPVLSFASFTSPGELGHYIPPSGRYSGYCEWVLPDAVLVSLDDGSQHLVRVDGTSQPAPAPVWHCYAGLPDGACLFSNDGGKSITYGKVDWPTFTADWWIDRPDLARFAEPLGEGGWPARVNTWIPLRDGSGVVILAPGEGDVVLARLSRQGAKP